MSRATNGLGWVVEQYARETGWAVVTQIFPTQEAANDELSNWQAQDAPVRVYEALDLNYQRKQ